MLTVSKKGKRVDVRMRVTEEEKKLLHKFADKEGYTLSDFMRLALKKEIERIESKEELEK